MDKPQIMLASSEKGGNIISFLQKHLSVVEVTGEDVIKSIYVTHPDIVIISSSISAKYDISMCRSIRAVSNVPIIIISLDSTDEDIINGLNGGADDYLPKHFNNKELLARIATVLRRSVHEKYILQLPWAEINKFRKTLTIDGTVVHLTEREFELLWTLARRPGKVFTKEELLKEVWGFKHFDDSRVVSAYVQKIRKKLQMSGIRPLRIRTVCKVGFKLEVYTNGLIS